MNETDPQWPFVCQTRHPYPQVQALCEQNIGEFDRDWYKLGEDITAQFLNTHYQSTYMFKLEKHAVLFRLRWA